MHYTNPILYGDYSDPDVIRVGEDFYMISSSFTYLPGIPVLHSKDMVHWELIGYAASHLPFPQYDSPAHKRGTWAPSIRWHNGLFYVYVCLPDEGLIAFTTEDPVGEWTFHYVKDVVGWIDPCPLFEEDGTAWLVHGLAASRAGINNMLYVHQLSADGFSVLDKGKLVYNGADHGDVTVEGPKFYKRDGKYWILCPAGGVKPGYQLALCSDSRFGPYERRVVLRQGNSPINGPHQGGWFDDGHGKDWFIHFQDVEEYGRVPHLQPVDWSDGWPVMGKKGEAVTEGETGFAPTAAGIPTSDTFENGLGLQWQWQANPRSAWYTELKPGLRLHCAPADNLFHAGQFMSQLMQSRCFCMDVPLSLHADAGDMAGIAVMGYSYHYLALTKGEIRLVAGCAEEISRWEKERVTEKTICSIPWSKRSALLRLRVSDGKAAFWYGTDRDGLTQLGDSYPLTCGGWCSARPGVFALNSTGRQGGWVDIEHVLFTPEQDTV